LLPRRVVLLLLGQEQSEGEVGTDVALRLLGERPRERQPLLLLPGAQIRLGQVEQNRRALRLHSEEVGDGVLGVVPGQQEQPEVEVRVAIGGVVTQRRAEFTLRQVVLLLKRKHVAQIVVGYRRTRVDREGLLEGLLRTRIVLLLPPGNAEKIQALV